MDAKHRRLEGLSCRAKRLLALPRYQETNQSPTADWCQHPHPKRRRILRHVQQQRPNKFIRQIVWQVNVVGLDLDVAILIRCAAGHYASSSFNRKVDGLHTERTPSCDNCAL